MSLAAHLVGAHLDDMVELFKDDNRIQPALRSDAALWRQIEAHAQQRLKNIEHRRQAEEAK